MYPATWVLVNSRCSVKLITKDGHCRLPEGHDDLGTFGGGMSHTCLSYILRNNGCLGLPTCVAQKKLQVL